MNDTIEITLLFNLFFYEMGLYTRNERFIEANKRKAVSILDEDANNLKYIDEGLYNDYKETIAFLENISEEEYQYIKNDIVENVMEFIKNER
ncbi:transcriptional regulator [Streptococcus halitosis]|uniref:transcriptional regulator n=1 Tax=Streptococcus halitosis TaxID=2172545 RepID=UPI002006526F|nr:transcriptional regulator [Streptococcus halitosis]MCK6128962.1 transcriptional regulator [Streptococcus halitosis]MCK6215965.1 transcriptional regulator [Streptococcus halitosis]